MTQTMLELKPRGAEDTARISDHETSKLAGASQLEKRTRMQQDVISAFKECGAMTDEALTALPRFTASSYAEGTIRKRRSELYKRGIIVAARRTLNSRGSSVIVWDLASVAYKQTTTTDAAEQSAPQTQKETAQ